MSLFQRCIKPLELPAFWQFQGFSAGLLAAGRGGPAYKWCRLIATLHSLALEFCVLLDRAFGVELSRHVGSAEDGDRKDGGV